MQYYAYVYRDTRPEKNNEPIYVGKGRDSRAHYHLTGSQNKYLNAKIAKMRALGLEPDIEIIHAIDEQHAFFLEECLIDIFGRQDLGTGSLVNHTNGGEGVSGIIMSEVTRARMSAAKVGKAPPNKGIPLREDLRLGLVIANTGKKASAETKAKMSATRLGKKLPARSDEYKAKQVAAHIGKPQSAETKAKRTATLKAKYAAGWAPMKGKTHSASTKAKMSGPRGPRKAGI